MIKAQHKAILAQVATILENDTNPGAQRTADLIQLSSLLLAHNTAEENAVYPALATAGMWIPSEVLYLEQSHGKIGHYELDKNSLTLAGTAWTAKVTALQAALVDYATVAEEGDYFPKLEATLSAAQNAALTVAFQNFFRFVAPF